MACILFISCKKEKSCDNCISNPPTTNNKPPIASAGPDQIITLPINSVEVNGIGSSDPDGTIVSYLWTKIYGPDTFFNIVNVSAVKTVINDLVKGSYQFELTVKDNGGLYSKDTIQITVNAAVPSSTQLAFWTDEGSICLCTGDPIYISVNNTTQILDAYYYGPRVTTCNDSHAIRFNLMPGTYSWLAVRGIDTARGSVIINANSCVLQEIKF
jgi:hypothetical protein